MFVRQRQPKVRDSIRFLFQLHCTIVRAYECEVTIAITVCGQVFSTRMVHFQRLLQATLLLSLRLVELASVYKNSKRVNVRGQLRCGGHPLRNAIASIVAQTPDRSRNMQIMTTNLFILQLLR